MPFAQLTGRQKAAALLVCIDREIAKQVLSNLTDAEIEAIALATKELDGLTPDREVLEEMLREGARFLSSGDLPVQGFVPRMTDLVTDALGPQKSKELISWATDGLAERPFEALEGLGPREVAEVLKGEHVQFVALYLAQVNSDRAAEIVKQLDRETAGEVLRRLASQGSTTVKTLARASSAVATKVKEMGLNSVATSDPGLRFKTVASILTRLDENAERKILKDIGKADQVMAKQIKDLMFVFEDLPKLDRNAMQKILSQFEASVIAMSLKGTTPELQDFILGHISKRARTLIAEEREMMGAVPIAEVLNAQEEILKVVRGMIESGEVKVRRGGANNQMVE